MAEPIISPFIKVGDAKGSIEDIQAKIIKRLSDRNFEILGHYFIDKETYKTGIIAFTNYNLKNTVVKVKDRGALAAIIKIGLVLLENNKVRISYTNPEYLAQAYLGSEYNKYRTKIKQFHRNLKLSLLPFADNFENFGGEIDGEQLTNYQYQPNMPKFSNPDIIKEFNSFEEGLGIISINLKNKIDKTKLIYVLLIPEKQIAVFGISINNSMPGSESFYLEKIGIEHVAAMPYEIILQGNKASILNAKYRLALFWPELSMNQFVKIISTPTSIKQTFERVCQPLRN